MKNDFNRKCLLTAIYTFGVILACMLLFFIFRDVRGLFGAVKKFFSVFNSIFIGFVISYIIRPIVLFFQRLLSKLFKNEKHCRIIAISVTYIIISFLFVILFWHLIPLLFENISFFATNFSGYVSDFEKIILDFSSKNEIFKILYDSLAVSPSDVGTFIANWFNVSIKGLIDLVFKATDFVFGFLLSFIISIYISYHYKNLCAQIKKTIFAIFSSKASNSIIKSVKVVDDSFSGYIKSVFFSSLIIGTLCFICMSAFGLEYAPLISFIVLITDVIPYFGPFIGAVLGSAVLLLVNPWDALIFLIIILVLQQITSNFINPSIIGKVTGLDSIYVILSIIVMGGLFGIVGMLIGVPIFVIILRIIRKFISQRKEVVKDNEEHIQQ